MPRRAMSLPLHALLVTYFDLLARRPDLSVREHEVGVGGLLAEDDARQLPVDVAAFYRACDGIRFTWVFRDHLEDADKFSPGYRGGRLNMHPFGASGVRWWPRDEWAHGEYAQSLVLDQMVEEGLARLVFDEGETPAEARVVFDIANRPDLIPMGTFNNYLTTGARRGFVWYWQNSGYWEAEDLLGRLRALSLPAETPVPEVLAALEQRGATPEQARALHVWLGVDVNLLLPRGEST
jgi:hypothetical protein